MLELRERYNTGAVKVVFLMLSDDELWLRNNFHSWADVAFPQQLAVISGKCSWLHTHPLFCQHEKASVDLYTERRKNKRQGLMVAKGLQRDVVYLGRLYSIKGRREYFGKCRLFFYNLYAFASQGADPLPPSSTCSEDR